jgi:hypothetical protein
MVAISTQAIGPRQVVSPSVQVPFKALPQAISSSTPSIANDQFIFRNQTDTRLPSQPISLFQMPQTPAKPIFNAIEAGKLNTTKTYSKADMPVSIKEALGPTIRIVEAVDPKLAAAIHKMDENDFVLADDGIHDMFAKHDIYAAWTAIAREKGTAKLHFYDMVLDDRFWKLRDAEKASVLMHEMVHANDIPIISNFEKLFGTIYNKVKGIEWGDPVEDRAYKHQYAMFDKLGIKSNDEIFWTAQTYLEDRGLIEPYKF